MLPVFLLATLLSAPLVGTFPEDIHTLPYEGTLIDAGLSGMRV